MKRRIISVVGKPGAGKGTKLKRFLEGRDGYTVVDIGKTLREEVKKDTDLGKMAKKYMDDGKLLPDYIAVNLAINQIKLNQTTNIILDSFPRNVEQAEAVVEFGCNIDRVVNVDISDSEMLARAKERVVCSKCGEAYSSVNKIKKPKVAGVCDKCGGKISKRSDDNEIVARKRLEVYNKETEPTLSFLRRCGVEVIKISGETFELTDEFVKAMTEFPEESV